MRTVVKVTAEDIRLGKPENPEYCALARAVKRMTVGGDVTVDGTGIEVACCKIEVLNGDLLDFVNEFDGNGESEKVRNVRPTTFILDIPCEVINPKAFKQVKF